MAVSRVTCPECKSVLKPTKPVPAGKAVKCPECGAKFTAGAAEAPLKKPKAGVTTAPKPKKTADKKPPSKKPVSTKPDDDEEGGTYGYMQEEEVAEEDKPVVEYAPDMSTKDLRGPAASALVQPSNWLIVVGALGFFGWLGVLVMILIPTLFPIDLDVGDKTTAKPVIGVEPGLSAVFDDKDPVAEPKNDPGRKSFYSFFGADLALVGLLPWYLFLVALLPLFFGMAYAGLVTYGAVQIQNLEGYRWGMASSIMAMIPLNTWGFMMTTAILAKFFIGMVDDDPQFLSVVMIFIMSVEALGALGVGIWVVTVLLSDTVIKGYEYKAD